MKRMALAVATGSLAILFAAPANAYPPMNCNFSSPDQSSPCYDPNYWRSINEYWNDRIYEQPGVPGTWGPSHTQPGIPGTSPPGHYTPCQTPGGCN